MKVLTHFDSALEQPYKIDGSVITMDLTEENLFNIIVEDIPSVFTVELRTEGRNYRNIAEQGLLASEDSLTFTTIPFDKPEEGILRAEITGTPGTKIQLSTRHPYGRDSLDRLLCDVYGTPYMKPGIMTRDFRTVPVFEFGEDDGRKKVHYIVGGEDVWETAGSWTTDEMIRVLCSDRALAEKLMKNYILRIIPLVSPYSAAYAKARSYCNHYGENRYGASTWNQTPPPGEFAVITDEVEGFIRQKRLALLLNIHSYEASYDVSSLETIRTSNENTLSEERAHWAMDIIDRLVRNVGRPHKKLAEKSWYPGLARDYLLGKYNFSSFRIEISTYNESYGYFCRTARQMLENLADIHDWDQAYGG